MAGVTISEVFDTVRSITNPNTSKKISDNITKNIPLLHFLDQMGHKEYESGGVDYRLPVFKDMQTGTAYSGATVITPAVPDPITTAVYNRKQLAWNVQVTGTDLLKNGGSSPEVIIDYMASLLETTEQSAKNDVAGDTIGIMSDQGDSDLGITGLQTYLPTSTSTGTVGGLSRVTYDWWRHQSDSVTTGFTTDGYKSMVALYIKLTRGMDAPQLIVMNNSTFANYNNYLTATVQYQFSNSLPAVGDVGFPDGLKFRGATVVHDAYTPSQTAYFLNLKYMKMLVNKDRDFAFRDWIAPADGDYMASMLLFAGNLCCSNLFMQGLLTGAPDTAS